MDTLRTDHLPLELYSAAQVREHEQEAAERCELNMWQLMERAGKAVCECLRGAFPPPLRVSVLCGSGNNGGDGYVAALCAQREGYDVSVFANKEPQSEDAKRARSLWVEAGNTVLPLGDWSELKADVVIDALLGTGLSDSVRGVYKDVIEQLNEKRLPVIAADIPSGLDANHGVPLGAAVKARHTVSMVALKTGLYCGAAKGFVGQLHLAGLGVLEAFREIVPESAVRLDQRLLATYLPARKQDAHKGSSGHVVIIGGAPGMAGAAGMAGVAAMRAGAGKVSVICAQGQSGQCAISPELMVREGDAQSTELRELVSRADIVAIGPGLGQSQWAKGWFDWIVASDKSLVVDADALNLLATRTVRKDNWVLTPHPGEAARLLAWKTSDIQAKRQEAAEQIQKRFGGTVVLKGAGTLVQHNEHLSVCQCGTPALATAGSGDILTGVIAGIWAQANALGVSQEQAAQIGVVAHALAGENAAKGKTRGIIASDLFAELVNAVNPELA
ncbi:MULTISPECIES: NAD(P)H-hydrate dehydratase [Gammaproteobacteria]|uniref:NAD(P)H-hydrate dehydratase n=1 Tax=Gammaproteobacteria TaxID=1236 RepID=UPI000DD092D4|nr:MULTISPECIES: NAD(P)H-hydrate dehydratase [Gammaproteobacteria]RTE86436.1 NAD(P)H-hydrate dehydratase [Aliidiomarina sp. B3213]TCZ91009.1 NAD(P)H-hydrate dehydratase [Lysobacter sp. N42]